MKLLSSLQKVLCLRSSAKTLILGVLLITAFSGAKAAPPVVNLTNLPSGTFQRYMVGSNVIFKADATDPDGSGIASYEWFVDGVLQEGQTGQTFVFLAFGVGEPVIRVDVTDNNAETASQTRTLTVRDGGFAPISVDLTAPSITSTTIFSIGENFSVTGQFNSSGETVDSIQLIENGVTLGSTTSTANSFSFSVDADEIGDFQYFALLSYARDIPNGTVES